MENQVLLLLKEMNNKLYMVVAKLDNIETNIAYIQGDIKNLRNDLNLVEEVTSKNWNEITRLKKMHQQ